MKKYSFQELYGESPLAIILSEENEMVNINAYGVQWLGYTQESLAELSIKDLVFAEDYEHFINYKKSNLPNKTIDIRFLKKNLKIVWGRISIRKQVDEKYEEWWLITDIHDLKTELDAVNQALEKTKASNRELENFASIAAHDLKEPLRTIGNFTQLLERKYANQLDTAGREYIHFIVNGVQNMYLFINDLLSYSKIKNAPHNLQSVQLESIILLVKNNLEGAIKNANANISINNMPKNIIADSAKLKQIFQHLLSNAIKFQRKDIAPLVEINGEERKEDWLFSITDNGIGIPEEYFSKVFLLFTKLHSKHEYPGNGMGLTICQKMVKQHKGKIWIESNPEDGVTFYFTISKN